MGFQFGIVKRTSLVRSNGKMKLELRLSAWFAVILSPQSAESMWVKSELSYALGQNRFENRIVPITHQPSDYERLSWTLSLFQMVDFTRTLEEGYRDLFRIWGVGYRNVNP